MNIITIEELAKEIGCEWRAVCDAAWALGRRVRFEPTDAVTDGDVPAIWTKVVGKGLFGKELRRIDELKRQEWEQKLQWEQQQEWRFGCRLIILAPCPDMSIQSSALPKSDLIDTAKYWRTGDVPKQISMIPPLPENELENEESFSEFLARAARWQRHPIQVITTHAGIVYLQDIKIEKCDVGIRLWLESVTVFGRNKLCRFIRRLNRDEHAYIEKDGFCHYIPAFCEWQEEWKYEDEWYWAWKSIKNIYSHPIVPVFSSWYTGNLKNAFQKRGFHFDAWKLFNETRQKRQGGHTFFIFLRYLYHIMKYPAFEILVKSGFNVDWSIDNFSQLNSNAANLRDIFGLNIREIREIRKQLFSGSSIAIYKEFKEKWTPITLAMAEFFSGELDPKRGWVEMDPINSKKMDPINSKWKNAYDFMELFAELTGFDPGKFLAWLYRDKMHIHDYLDYLNECLTLGLDIKNRDVVAPKHPMEAHRRTSMIVAQQRARELEAQRRQRLVSQDEQIAKAIRRNIPAVLVNGAFESGVYRATVARGNADLIAESMALGHCVGTGDYADAMSRGSSFIFFVRRRESPDAPFFTMELSPDFRILQLRGRFNCDPPLDVSAFANEFTAWLRRQEKPRRCERRLGRPVGDGGIKRAV
ncbi:MAG: PcfJ domain-containing protein [Acidobacteriota bacterium]|jgi:hypothetical protein|nr:PcfJ domain-containing protein [Acidobacteriota bacterium]